MEIFDVHGGAFITSSEGHRSLSSACRSVEAQRIDLSGFGLPDGSVGYWICEPHTSTTPATPPVAIVRRRS
jgi:hypothetical protein